MDQIKIGKFISENRKKQFLTQEQLAERLNISKNAVSKWERGLNLPDVSIMQDLCNVLHISLKELFIGEKINDNAYKKVADNNLLEAWENSSFTLKEKIAFFKKKWRKENRFKIVFSFMVWCALGIALKSQNVDHALIGAVSGLLSVLFYAVLYNNMMIYVENNAYKKQRKIDIQIHIIVLCRHKKNLDERFIEVFIILMRSSLFSVALIFSKALSIFLGINTIIFTSKKI